MAGVAGSRGGYMGGHRALGYGNRAVMAVLTQVRGFRMVKGCDRWNPTRAYMTGFAEITGHRMGRRFKRPGTYAIVTTHAGTGLSRYQGVIKLGC